MREKEELPVPLHYDPDKVGEVWRVPYQERAEQARAWAEMHGIRPVVEDDPATALVLIDIQNTFCLPGFELFVGGRSGRGAVEDNQRLCEFMYRNLGRITQITATLDTHRPLHIFHALFLVDEEGEHPPANTMITHQDVRDGKWRVNPAAVKSQGLDPKYAERFLHHYTKELAEKEKFDLTIWPYHSMLGGIGHALVPAVEEASFFHSVARHTQLEFILKGRKTLTEHYSAVGPEVLEDQGGEVVAEKSTKLLRIVKNHDRVIIAGQAMSHCVAWTVSDLLDQILEVDPSLAEKVYLLEDCTTPIVIPDVIDFTEDAERAFNRFAEHGMHIVSSTDPVEKWPSG